jgi:hypothetical protein
MIFDIKNLIDKNLYFCIKCENIDIAKKIEQILVEKFNLRWCSGETEFIRSGRFEIINRNNKNIFIIFSNYNKVNKLSITDKNYNIFEIDINSSNINNLMASFNLTKPNYLPKKLIKEI